MGKTVAIIPARGGSKRLPGKNVIEIEGKPALYYPVRTARESGLFDRIIVSTEDERIVEVALKTGAEVMVRPKSLAQDRSTVAQVCRHVLETLSENGEAIEIFCCIYATALFIKPEDLNGALAQLEGQGMPDVVMGVSQFNLQPVQSLERQASGFLAHKWPEFSGVQSQFQPELVASNGTFYWARAEKFRKIPLFIQTKWMDTRFHGFDRSIWIHLKILKISAFWLH